MTPRSPLATFVALRPLAAVVAPLLAALTAYLLLDRNHAEELGGGARVALDVLLGAEVRVLVPALVAVALAGWLARGVLRPVRIAARSRER